MRERVLRLNVRIVGIGPRLILRWGRGVEGLTRIGWLGDVGMTIVGGGRVERLIGWVRILTLRIIGR